MKLAACCAIVVTMGMGLSGVCAESATAPASAPTAGTVPLKVDFGNAKPAGAFPVCGGVPFARGELIDIGTVRLLQGGTEVDCQAAPLAYWPDGSLKWVKVDFFATPGQEFMLSYGGQKRAQVGQPLVAARREDGGVVIDTGPLKVTVRKDGSGFLDEVSFQGKPIVAPGQDRRNFVDFVHVEDTSAYQTMSRAVDGTPDPSTVEITTLDIEEPGPLHAVVLIRGLYRYRTVGGAYPEEVRPKGCPFALRLHFYRGSGLVTAEHFFVYEGDPDHDFISRIGLALPVGIAGEGCRATYGGEVGEHATAAAASELYQYSCDNYLVAASESPGAPASTVALGRRAAGWVDLTGRQAGVCVGIRRFWQQYAKALHADLAAGRVSAYLWPAEAAPLDYRRYARVKAVGETGIGSAKGTGKVHELMFYFHVAGAEAGGIAEDFRAFEARPLVLAPLERYSSTAVLGYYHPRQAGEMDDLEQTIQNAFDYWRFCQERFRWYGFFDYGDVQSFYNTYNTQNRWDNDYGRWGWAGGDQQGRLNYALLLQYVRTGQRRNFELAEANVRHVHSVDAVHSDHTVWEGAWTNLRGAVHRHNAQHWADSYTPARGAHPVGVKIYYYLTGDGWARDALDEVLEMAVRGGASESEGPAMQSFLCAWERTRDDKHRQMLLAAIRNSGMTESTTGWNTMLTAAFGMSDAMVEYMDLTGDKQFVETISRFAANCTEPSVVSSWTWPGGYFRIYAEALRITGDQRWAEALNKALGVWLDRMKRCGSALPQEEWPGRFESTTGGGYPGAVAGVGTDANTFRDLPFAMEAVISAKGANR